MTPRAPRRRPEGILGGGFMALIALGLAVPGILTFATAQDSAAPATPTSELLVREQQSMQAVCGARCHRLELFASARKGYDEWHETVQKMIDRGAVGTDEQLMDIMDYLYQTQTIVDVNSADPEDLQIVLDISAPQAQAIAARRTKKKFSSLADLKSIAGLDAAKLDARATQLTFK